VTITGLPCWWMRRTGVNEPKSAPNLRFEQIFGFETKVQGSKRSFAKRSPRMSRGNREALRSEKSQRCLKEEKKERKDQSKRDNAEHHVYRIYGTCKQSSRQSDCGKLMVGFGKNACRKDTEHKRNTL